MGNVASEARAYSYPIVEVRSFVLQTIQEGNGSEKEMGYLHLKFARSMTASAQFLAGSVNKPATPILLHWEDRISMQFSIESRVPFLDYRLAEFAFNLPDEYKISGAARKFILREALREELPQSIYYNGMRKLGFASRKRSG